MSSGSKLIEEATNEMAKLPGIGRKTAMRLVLNFLKKEPIYTERLAESLIKLRTEIKFCQDCHNVSDGDLCSICTDKRRDKSLICVVIDLPDLMAIESTMHYHGLYHILGGLIAPVQGVKPEDIKIQSLIDRIKKSQGEVKEVILALSATMEGDTTAFYLSKKLAEFKIKITSIARGIPMGGELEFTDEITLARSIMTRSILNQNL